MAIKSYNFERHEDSMMSTTTTTAVQLAEPEQNLQDEDAENKTERNNQRKSCWQRFKSSFSHCFNNTKNCLDFWCCKNECYNLCCNYKDVGYDDDQEGPWGGDQAVLTVISRQEGSKDAISGQPASNIRMKNQKVNAQSSYRASDSTSHGNHTLQEDNSLAEGLTSFSMQEESQEDSSHHGNDNLGDNEVHHHRDGNSEEDNSGHCGSGVSSGGHHVGDHSGHVQVHHHRDGNSEEDNSGDHCGGGVSSGGHHVGDNSGHVQVHHHTGGHSGGDNSGGHYGDGVSSSGHYVGDNSGHVQVHHHTGGHSGGE